MKVSISFLHPQPKGAQIRFCLFGSLAPCGVQRFRREHSLVEPMNLRASLHLPLLHTLVEERARVGRTLFRLGFMGLR